MRILRSLATTLGLFVGGMAFASSSALHSYNDSPNQITSLRVTYFLQPDAVDVKTLLTAPPLADSLQTKAEIMYMLHLQNGRTAAQVRRAQSESDLSPFAFSSVLGSWFNSSNLPYTTKLLYQAGNDAGVICLVAKDYFHRERPYVLDPRIIKPCVQLTPAPWSYPSGHTTQAMVWAIVLSDLFPEDRKALMARANQIGNDRIMCGAHYPSDVAAGSLLGQAIAQKLLANPALDAALQKARQECLAKNTFAVASLTK